MNISNSYQNLRAVVVNLAESRGKCDKTGKNVYKQSTLVAATWHWSEFETFPCFGKGVTAFTNRPKFKSVWSKRHNSVSAEYKLGIVSQRPSEICYADIAMQQHVAFLPLVFLRPSSWSGRTYVMNMNMSCHEHSLSWNFRKFCLTRNRFARILCAAKSVFRKVHKFIKSLAKK